MEVSDELEWHGVRFGELVERRVVLPQQVQVLLPWPSLSGFTAETLFGGFTLLAKCFRELLGPKRDCLLILSLNITCE